MLTLLLPLLFQVAAVAPRAAVDHQVVMADTNGVGRTTIRRSGSRLREDDPGDPNQTTYTDLHSGLTVIVTVERDGSARELSVEPGGLRSERRLPPTGRRDRALGESCTVSRLVNQAPTGDPSGTEVCETADGIPLWMARWSAAPPETHIWGRAVSLERRPIRAAELRLPDLAAEAARFLRTARNTPRAVDYEVRFAAYSPNAGEEVTRRHGGLLSWEGSEGGVRDVTLTGDEGEIAYSEDAAGRPLSLRINATSRRPQSWRLWPNRPAEQVLGETCLWYSVTTNGGLDGSGECRTADGIPLRTESYYHLSSEPLRRTATSVSRRPLTDADVALPPRAFDWASWGVTSAP